MLKFLFKYLSASAIPTAFANPCPNGPVDISTPGVTLISGCPGVLEFSFLNPFKSSSVISNPDMYSVEYNNADACPADKTNLSLLIQFGLFTSNLKKFVYKLYIIGAAPSATPGCPPPASLIMSILSPLILSITFFSSGLISLFFINIKSLSYFNYIT